MANSTCPDIEQLTAFNEGCVDDELMQQITDHLAVCEGCIDRLEQLPPSNLAEGLRRASEPLNESSVKNPADGSPFLTDSSDPSPVEWESFLSSAQTDLGCDRYLLIAIIGNGRFGSVYLGSNDDSQAFAIKIPSKQNLYSTPLQEIFLSDVMRGYLLKNLHIAPIVDYGYWQPDVPFVVTKFINNTNLKAFAKSKKKLSPDSFRTIFWQLCSAVRFAHDNNTLHRHLNPSNIFFVDDNAEPNVQVTDFSLHYDGRYQFGLIEPLTDATPFDSPESQHNDPDFVDQRTDVYSLGKILKLMLRITPDLSVDRRSAWEKIQDKCSQKRRRLRHQNMDELMDEIKRI